jgi:hypothetical protein
MTDSYQPGVISLLVPSRMRPDGCRAMWLSALDTADDPLTLQLVLYLDDDDPTLAGYHAWVGATDHLRIKALTGPRIVLSETWNRCWAVADGEIGWHGNDDIRFRSEGWDKTVRDEFEAVPDRIVFVHGADGIQNAVMGTHGFLHRRWTETVGTFCPPYFSSDYNDLWFTRVADALGRRRYLPHVETEHLHPAAGKGPLDQTHQDRLVRHRQDNVDQLWRDTVAERAQWAERLRAVMA